MYNKYNFYTTTGIEQKYMAPLAKKFSRDHHANKCSDIYLNAAEERRMRIPDLVRGRKAVNKNS